jgi:hypothetical protein
MSSVPVPRRTRWLGAGFVLAAILFQAFWLGLPAMFVSVALLISYGLWISTSWQVRPRLRVAFTLAILLFVGHVVEEFLTGIHQALPGLFARAPWSEMRYLVFNGAWALIFFTAAVALRPGRSLPVLIILFFAVAGGVGNGVLHLFSAALPSSWHLVAAVALRVRTSR